jgi:hypothetical protein
MQKIKAPGIERNAPKKEIAVATPLLHKINMHFLPVQHAAAVIVNAPAFKTCRDPPASHTHMSVMTSLGKHAGCKYQLSTQRL